MSASPGFGGILDHADPQLYRNQRGHRGDDPRMVAQDQRVIITTGETQLPSPLSQPNLATAAFDPNGVGLGIIVLGLLLLIIHARFAVSASAAAGVGSRK